MALKLCTLLAVVAALSACAPPAPPSCHGSVVGLNAGQWQPTQADLQVAP